MVYVKNNLLISNDEALSIDFDFLSVTESVMRPGEYSIWYQRGTEAIELMLGVKTLRGAINIIKQLREQLDMSSGHYSKSSDLIIVNLDKFKSIKSNNFVVQFLDDKFFGGCANKVDVITFKDNATLSLPKKEARKILNEYNNYLDQEKNC